MSDFVFRRINGRIIPIKRKTHGLDEVKNIIKKSSRGDAPSLIATGAGFGVASAGGYYSGKVIKNSWDAFRSSAHIRGEIKNIKSIRPTMIPHSLYREAAGFKLAGKVMARRGFGVLAVTGLVGSAVAGYGASRYLENKTSKEKQFAISSAVGALATAVGIGIFARKSNTKYLISALRATGGKTGVRASDIYKAWTKHGQKRTAETIKKYSDLAKSGAAKRKYSYNISKTVEQLKKVSKRRNNYDPNQGTLF